MTLIFDTLKLAQTLRGPFTPEQSEQLAKALRDSTEENVATKADIQELRAEIGALRGEFKSDIAALRNEMAVLRTDVVRWVVTGIAVNFIGMAGMLFAFVKAVAK